MHIPTPPMLRAPRTALLCALLLSSACADDETAREGRDAEQGETGDDADAQGPEDTPSEPSARLDAAREPVTAEDARVANDAGAARDAGRGRDAAMPQDTGPRADAGRPADAGANEDGEIGPSACLEKFKAACTPAIVFSNEEPTGRGAIFASVIPDPVATMQDAVCTVCSILFREPSEIPMRARHQSISLTLRDNPNVADASGNTIRIDLKHIAGYKDAAKALREFRGIMVHEGTHLYQNYGNNGLGEGMADFVRIRVGLYEPGRRRPGGAWTDPYTTSGFFFSWLAGPGVYHKDGREPHNVDIGYLINKTIGADGADAVPALLEKSFGQDVDTLWRAYQDAIQ